MGIIYLHSQKQLAQWAADFVTAQFYGAAPEGPFWLQMFSPTGISRFCMDMGLFSCHFKII